MRVLPIISSVTVAVGAQAALSKVKLPVPPETVRTVGGTAFPPRFTAKSVNAFFEPGAGVTPVPGSKNALTDLAVKRGGKAVQPTVRTVSGGTGNFTYDYPAWAPTGSVTLEMVGKTRTISCVIAPEVLRQFR